MSDIRQGDWMQTYSGRQFWPLDPRPSEVHIEDIAHALSNMCRFAGHCERFYSVAEHSVHVSHLVPRDCALTALLHDATEAYCVDMPRPLKRFITGYAAVEERLWTAIADQYDLPHIMDSAIKYADNQMLRAEAAQNMKTPPVAWNDDGVEPCATILRYLPPHRAEALFLARFAELTE